MTSINRSLILVIPKQAFYDWSNGIFPTLPPTKMERVRDHNSYLLADELFLDDLKTELKPYWKNIFESELFGQCTDETKWPPLTWKLFTEWFTIHKSSIITDLSDDVLFQAHYD